MVREVQKNIYALELVFPNRRVKSIDEIKLFLIRGEERNLLIDAGLNEPEYEALLRADLQELGVTMENTDIFVTHMHTDHSGLLNSLVTPSTKVYALKTEADTINQLCFDQYWRIAYYKYVQEGLPMDYQRYLDSHPNCAYMTKTPVDFTVLKEGDIISIGGYNFRTIIFPGHSAGHTSLYDEEKKLLIGGDVILSDVPPILFFEENLSDPLGSYLDSMERLKEMDIDMILACHAESGFDVAARAQELEDYYETLCGRIVDLLKEHGSMNAWETAGYTIKFQIPKELDGVSDVSKWFFYLPTCMCLRHMACTGRIRYHLDENGVYRYSA